MRATRADIGGLARLVSINTFALQHRLGIAKGEFVVSDNFGARNAKGFHSTDNQDALKETLQQVVLPRKGKLSRQAKEIESAPEFVRARRAHSAVESAINGLEVHGLEICHDHGIEGFKRYVAWAVVARNVHRIGTMLWQQDVAQQQRLAKAEAGQRRTA